ncbi:hypothetical protein TrRE_jg8276, partial [Triparma retinervis]
MWVRMDDFHPITFGRKSYDYPLSAAGEPCAVLGPSSQENSCILYDYYDPT